MPEAFIPLTDFVNESKSIPRDHSLDKPVAKWTEEEVLDGEVVEAGVVILRTRGCYWSIKEGCSMCGYFNDTVPGGVSDDMLREQWKKVRPILKGKKESMTSILGLGDGCGGSGGRIKDGGRKLVSLKIFV